jgi:superfamily II DNA or RNA helicase
MIMKVCDLNIVGDTCRFSLYGCSDDEFDKIEKYKQWISRSWKYGNRSHSFVNIIDKYSNPREIWTYLGFAPNLIRYLKNDDFKYIIDGKEFFTGSYIVKGREVFIGKEIIVGNLYYSLWDFQKEAVDAWIDNGGFGIIKSPTGSGKGVMACDIIRRIGKKTLILVHTSDLLINVWFNTLVEQFSEGIKGRLGIIGGGLTKKDRKQMRLSSDCSFEFNINKSIVIATSQAMLNKLDMLSKQRFGLLVVDEVHHYSSEQFKKVASVVSAPYRLGLSATLNRPDGTSPLFYGLLGDPCFDVGIKKLVKKGILVEPKFYKFIIDDKTVQMKIATCGLQKLDLSRYIKKMSASSVIKKDYIIYNLVKLLHEFRRKFIMYTDFVKPSDEVFTRDDYVKEILRLGVNVIGVDSELSSNQREKLFNDLKVGKLEGLIFGALGSEGVNIPAVDSVVMCNATASPIRFPQRVGRSMRSVRNDSNKKAAYIYEICLNTSKELDWTKDNFHEYEVEGYFKEEIRSKEDLNGFIDIMRRQR